MFLLLPGSEEIGVEKGLRMNTIGPEALALLPKVRDELTAETDPKWDAVKEAVEYAVHPVWGIYGTGVTETRPNCSDWPQGALAGALYQIHSFDALEGAIFKALDRCLPDDDMDLAVLTTVMKVHQMEKENTA